ncbi:metallopeptidase family protein [Xanthobacter oligotrophicus]|uniref:metallopeptidase family protein n=1 Tax=Xanthobacter oligotrophicus TaxID=2607286 RepID=UPI0011F3C456|nr:metallopeptidase family protein [Xanthobacter oligotrophicus]MCG5237023.1 metallopeptidase family protein [Xanthobacter oligotrophicus]
MSQKSAGESEALTVWRDLEAPGIAVFEELARDAFSRLPDSFRALCEGLVIRIEDFPTDEVLDEMDAETPFDLLGLFQGVGRAQADAVAHTGQMPNMVSLYRRPILDYWAENEETLGDVVTHVLVHEIGHHFGLSDGDMEAIEDRAN